MFVSPNFRSRSSSLEGPGCSKAAKWSPFFGSLSRRRRAFGRRLLGPLRVRRGLGVVVVVPVPPFVRRSLRVTLWRVLPSFPTAERREVEITPGGPDRLVAAVVDEVCAEFPAAVAEEQTFRTLSC
jgi:hypothetical protein